MSKVPRLMSKKGETPSMVNELVRAVSEKLGREAIARKVNNREQYFILDLAFSYFQKADRNRRNDYRSGYLYFSIEDNHYLLFAMAHTPVMTSFFKNNFEYEVFRNIVVDTEEFRNEHYLRFKRNGTQELIRTMDMDSFMEKLDEIENSGFVKTVFAKSKTGKTGIGNIFGLRLADNFSQIDIIDIITKSWSLFLWLYPSKPVFQRNAALNRSLHKIENRCEIREIGNLPKAILKTTCSGQIEGAHIKSHGDGGSDKLANGLWLCNTHHRLTEGKLAGQRSIDTFAGRFEE
jgi:hypothetical protein